VHDATEVVVVDRAGRRRGAGELLMPVTAPLVAALNVIAPPAALPIWLLLMLIEFTTAPVFEIPVKPPVVAVDVVPRMMLLFMLSEPGTELLMMPTNALDDAAPVTAHSASCSS
jgi:hypothetical protein